MSPTVIHLKMSVQKVNRTGNQTNSTVPLCKPVHHTPAALHMWTSIQMFLNNHFPLQTGNYAPVALPSPR